MADSRLLSLYERARDSLGMSDAEVMRAAGLPANWITEYKSDRKRAANGARLPRMETLQRLAKGLRAAGVSYRDVAQAAAEDYYDVDLAVDDDRYLLMTATLDELSTDERAELLDRARKRLGEFRGEDDPEA